MTGTPSDPSDVIGADQPLDVGTAQGGAELGQSATGLGFTSEVGDTPAETIEETAEEQTLAQTARDTAERAADAVRERR